MRKRWMGPLTVVLILVGFFLPVLFPRPPRVTRASFDRIEEGMSRPEVETILGGRPGDHRTRPGWPIRTSRAWSQKTLLAQGHGDVWLGDTAEIRVYFEADLVHAKLFWAVEPERVGPIALTLWRLDRLKNHCFS